MNKHFDISPYVDSVKEADAEFEKKNTEGVDKQSVSDVLAKIADLFGLPKDGFILEDSEDSDEDNDESEDQPTGDKETQGDHDEAEIDASESKDIDENDPVAEKVANSISTPEGIKELISKHPEKADLWNSQLEALETLNDPEASPAEIRSAQAKLSILKGQLMEVAVKDALSEAGFDVESKQRVVEGESGGTRPDVVAVNNTDHPIKVFGVTIQPGETLSVECKCGGSAYMTNQLINHIPNQLSGQEGTKVLLTTSDVNETPDGLANEVCDKYDATLMALNTSVSDVENAIKEVANE